MYRVFDVEEQKWVRDGIYLSLDPYNELCILKKNIFGGKKLIPAPNGKYEYHKDIGLYDKNNILIFEGDHVKAEVSEGRIVTGVVSYVSELAAYAIFCFDVGEYFVLGKSVCEYVEVVGNVFDNKKNT